MIQDQLIQAIVTLFGIVVSFAYYPQAWRIWKLKASDEISIPSISLFVAGTSVWLFYGFYKSDNVIVASFLFGAVGSWLVLLLTLFFRRKKVESEQTGR